MSTFHLMRNFIALLRMLGYSRFVSLENFRRPNFPLMTDILCYLLKRFDSSVEINTKIDTEQDRLAFVRNTSQIMVSKAHLDINTKKLYMADVNSVPEMLKLAKLIYDAWKALKANQTTTAEELQEKTGEGEATPEINFDRNVYNNFKTNQLTSEILQMGTQLFDVLAEEDTNKAQRAQVLSKQIVIEQIESTLRQSIAQLQEETSSLQDRKEALDQDNEDLNGKIEKKFAELNRNRKRLQQLNSQRPVFMDELEKVEEDIVRLYDTYVINSRCLFFLEQKLEEFEEVEKMKIEERNEEIKQMLEQMRADEFLKEGKALTNGTNGESGSPLAIIEDEEVDIPSDDGEGSDISDAMARDLEAKTKTTTMQGRTKPMVPMMSQQIANNKKPVKNRAGNKDRSLLVNTVTVAKQREPRSSKTARIYSYGSLLADDDDDEADGQLAEDDEDTDEQLSKSEEIAKMTDSEIDLDAIDSDVESNGSANLNLSDDFAPGHTTTTNQPQGPRPKPPPIGNASKLATKYSFDKSDDNF